MGNGPRATPAIDENAVYAFTGEGVLAAVALQSGKLLWKVDTVKQLGGKAAEYGMASSPLVVGNVVVVHAGTNDAAVAAFDTKEGELQWKAGSGPAGSTG